MNLGWVCANMTSSLSIFQLFSIGFRQEDLFHRQNKYQFTFLIASFQKIGNLPFLFSLYLSLFLPSFLSFFIPSFLSFSFYTWTEVLVRILIRANEIMWLLSQFLRKSNSLIFQWNHNLILEQKGKSIPFSCRSRFWSPVLRAPTPPLPSCCRVSPSHSPTLGISEYSAAFQTGISKVSCSFHLGSLLCKEILAFKKG